MLIVMQLLPCEVKMQRTCTLEVMRSGGLNFCGGPASFHYRGIVQVRQGETYLHALARRGRISHDLCMDHTRDVFIRMEPALRDGSASVQCLEFTKLTLYCKACVSTFRLQPLNPVTVRSAAQASQSNGYFLIPNHFCPNCGQPCVSTFDPTLDWWELTIGAIDPTNQLQLNPQLVQEIYAAWQRDPTATSKFVEYVQSIISELDATA